MVEVKFKVVFVVKVSGICKIIFSCCVVSNCSISCVVKVVFKVDG